MLCSSSYIIRKLRLTYRASVQLRRSSEVRVALVGKSQLPDDHHTRQHRIVHSCRGVGTAKMRAGQLKGRDLLDYKKSPMTLPGLRRARAEWLACAPAPTATETRRVNLPHSCVTRTLPCDARVLASQVRTYSWIRSVYSLIDDLVLAQVMMVVALRRRSQLLTELFTAVHDSWKSFQCGAFYMESPPVSSVGSRR
jgi:hypothetical protein